MTSKPGAGSNGHDDDLAGPLVEPQDIENDGASDTLPGEEEEEVDEEEDNRHRMAEIERAEQKQHVREVEEALNGSASNEADIGRLNEETTLPPTAENPPNVEDLSSISGPDDTPSLQGSVQSTPSSVPGSRASYRSPRSPSSQPFERRFKARVISGSPISRALSPAFLNSHSRKSSVSSQLTLRSQGEEGDEPAEDRKPWDVVRWTKLKKISQQAFSESGKRAFGRPTFLCIGASIAIGTSKGIILLFDYQQTLKSIIGQGTAAAECGSITALAISADHTTVAGGHSNGTIFTWELSRPARPFLHIPPMDHTQLSNRSADGHVADSAILHVGFLGQRHTALVSADDSGMAFSHLATRGLGAVARSVKTTRILGRYPDASTTRKPSSVLAFAPLPLGNVEHPTDDFGLTALLTPYLLVIVSTTPIAQTQFKSPRPKDIAAHSPMTGCLSWFPAVRLKDGTDGPKEAISKAKLVYCWSNVLNILEVQERKSSDPDDALKRPELAFKQYGHWRSEEAILAVQWLSRSIIAVLTITQRMVILEDTTLRVADSSDLNSKHIYHHDLFSRQLQPLVDKIEQGDGSMHGVLPDAYHMSFKAYKGRLFLLGMSDVSMGTLSNWADRLVATMKAGNPIAAIELATSYYTGEADRVTIGLPDDATSRHSMVKDKLLELLSSSLQYILNDETNRNTEQGLRTILEEYARVSFKACVTMHEVDFLFDQVYERFSDASMQDIFLYEAEPYVLDGRIDYLPPEVLKDLLTWYEIHDFGARLEELICSLQTSSMDIDQVSSTCKRMGLYDALIYVWNQALDDFVTPLIDLMALIPIGDEGYFGNDQVSQQQIEMAMKMFPYMAYSLTGRRYPSGSDLSAHQAIKARASMYGFLFSGRLARWPKTNGSVIPAGRDEDAEKTYPYLRKLLHFDAFNLLSMLNEAFEDNFLNGESDQLNGGAIDEDLSEESFGMTINRQRIVNILLEVVGPPDFEPDDKILLDIFLARNLAKFQFLQYILLSGSVLHRLLVELCSNSQDDLKAECQLSVEYLLTVYKPPDTQELVSLLHKAKYYRVLKSTYRGSKQYAKWLETHFQDPDGREAVFSCIGDCLRPSVGLSKRQIQDVKSVISKHSRELCGISVSQTAKSLEMYADDLLDATFNSLDSGSQLQYLFLQTIFEPKDSPPSQSEAFRTSHQEKYVKLMCSHDRQHVADYVNLLESGNLRLDSVLPTMEENGIIDAAVILLQHDGLAREAMNRLVKHLDFLKLALGGLLNLSGDTDPDQENTEEAVDDLLKQMERYVKLGTWLCQGEGSKTLSQTRPPSNRRGQSAIGFTEEDLTPTEMLWLDLTEVAISLHRVLPEFIKPAPDSEPSPESKPPKTMAETAADTLRALVQTTFTALLAATTSGAPPSRTLHPLPQKPQLAQPPKATPRFPPLLSTLLTRLSHTTSTGAVLPLLSTLFASYAFEASILTLAQQFLDKDVFALVEEADARRRRGWKPASRACEECGRRCWGPGAGRGLWEAWAEKSGARARHSAGSSASAQRVDKDGGARGEASGDASSASSTAAKGKGKGKGRVRDKGKQRAVEDEAERVDALVVFSCQHLFHKACLERALQRRRLETREVAGAADAGDVELVYRCPVCK